MMRALTGALAVLAATVPLAAAADATSFVFATEPQTIGAGATSGAITIQAQSGGASTPLTQTGCIALATSAAGEFSSSATNWNPLTVLTMNKSTANRTFYYKSPHEGTHTLTVTIALKPEGENRTCANWPTGEWTSPSTVTQAIVIGTAERSDAPQSSTPSAESAATTSSTGTTAPAPQSSYVPPPVPTLFADAGADRTVIVGADVDFFGRAYDRDRETLDRVRLVWNFGDGTVGEGPSVRHRFAYPGRYVVVLDIAYDRTDVSDQVIVTAEPAKLAFDAMADGSVAIENRSGRELDLSGWVVRQFARDFALPENSRVLAGDTLRISSQTLGYYANQQAQLLYPNGFLALRAGDASAAPPQATVVPTLAAAPVLRSVRVVHAQEQQPLDGAAEPLETEPSFESATSMPAAAAAAGGFSWWWLAALALGIGAGCAVAVARKRAKGEWTILDE